MKPSSSSSSSFSSLWNNKKILFISSLFSLLLLPHHITHAQRTPQPRIVGGSNAAPNEFPYFVQMGLCGGALIAPGIVVSAAHCKEIFGIGVYVTINPYRIKDATAKRVKIVERVFHPWYWDEWASYDVILLRLEEPIYYYDDNDDIDNDINDAAPKLIVNPNRQYPPDNITLTTFGFGILRESSNRFPTILKKVELESMNLEYCNKTLDYNLWDDSFVCAGSWEGGKDSCQGDSGGPLVRVEGDTHILVGLVSWGEGCGDAGIPGAYARVSSAFAWIQQVVCDCWKVEGASFCSDSIVEQQRSFVVNTAAEEEEVFDCPLRVDPNCQDTPGYVDYVGDRCPWHEEHENPGCIDYGDSLGGPGFEDTNALSECCWCGGGSIIIKEEESSPVKFERDPECTDMPGWVDQHGDDCEWYEGNTDEGTCSGWGGLKGGSGMRNIFPESACCHCGGGNFPTAAPSPMPSMAPSISFKPTEFAITQNPTATPDAQAPELDGPTTGADSSSGGTSSTNGLGDSGAMSWHMHTKVSLGMILLLAHVIII